MSFGASDGGRECTTSDCGCRNKTSGPLNTLASDLNGALPRRLGGSTGSTAPPPHVPYYTFTEPETYHETTSGPGNGAHWEANGEVHTRQLRTVAGGERADNLSSESVWQEPTRAATAGPVTTGTSVSSRVLAVPQDKRTFTAGPGKTYEDYGRHFRALESFATTAGASMRDVGEHMLANAVPSKTVLLPNGKPAEYLYGGYPDSKHPSAQGKHSLAAPFVEKFLQQNLHHVDQ